MSTLKELVDEHGMNIKAVNAYFGVFIPKFFDEDGRCFGLSHGLGVDLSAKSDKWSLYIEPKPKVMRAHYMIKSTDSEIPWTTGNSYKNDEEFFHNNNYPMEWFKRLEEVECES